MTTVVFSLGQLISSNVQTLKSAFQSALAEEGKDIQGDAVWAWLTSYLPRLRLNQITLENLCGEFNTHFAASMSVPDFTNHFNSMCRIDEASLARVAQFNDFLNEHPDIHFLVVSHTNVSHFDYIMEQLERVIPACRTGIIDNNTTSEQGAQILFATSMFSQCEQHPDTLRYAFNKLEISLDQPIISFLNSIQQVDQATDFTYIPADPILNADKVIEVLSSLHEQKTVRCGL